MNILLNNLSPRLAGYLEYVGNSTPEIESAGIMLSQTQGITVITTFNTLLK
ncbi:hypothetical protein [Desulfosediminicola flagellatus]|uniref:hypothetical protein n=1 Tax=Desulfosediminicola flagellatus TaxID=2569541 RepID=UPI00129485C5|nr:hypothetical protein [Desulfosediminicola flagellatus]